MDWVRQKNSKNNTKPFDQFSNFTKITFFCASLFVSHSFIALTELPIHGSAKCEVHGFSNKMRKLHWFLKYTSGMFRKLRLS